MERIYVFLIRNDVWIYILCGLGLLWYLAELIRSRRALRRAVFGLEKERGRRLYGRSLMLVFVFAIIIAAVTYVNLSVAPTLPPELLRPPTPTPNIFVTPLSSPTPIGGEPTPTLLIAPTVTLPVPPAPPETLGSTVEPGAELEPDTSTTATPEPTRPPVTCNPGSNITAPPDGAVLSGSATFFGTATNEDFNYFTLEVNGPRTNGVWSPLPVDNATRPVIDNIITSVDVSAWAPGEHRFRLSVFDSADNPAGQCEIQLSVISSGS
jgi:hypothetical protein